MSECKGDFSRKSKGYKASAENGSSTDSDCLSALKAASMSIGGDLNTDVLTLHALLHLDNLFLKTGLEKKSKYFRFSFQNYFQTDLLVMMGAGMGGRFESEVWPNMPGMSRSCLLCAKFKPFKPGIVRFPLTRPQENKDRYLLA